MSRRLGKGETVDGGRVPYTIEEDLSVGMFAVSYAARDPDGTRVFLKQYKSPSRLVPWYRDYIDYQKELKRRVESDPTLASRTYDFVDMFESGGSFIQVFGFIERGRDLRYLLESGKATPNQRWQFAESFVSALARFHGAGIVHTDLKPENVYLMPGPLGSGWNVKIIDFDFTVLSGMSIPWLGKMGWVGTPRYMSPEHLTGKVPEARSDVFTASLMIYELLAQGHPYPEDAEAYHAAALAGNPPAPQLRCKATPDAEIFATLLVRALSPKAAIRPTAGELYDALRAARDAFPKTGLPESFAAANSPSALPETSISVDPGTIVLSGVAGRTKPLRLGAEFGRKSLAGIIGEADARLTDSVQFRILRRAEADGWWIAAGLQPATNPPMLNGTVLTETPMPLRDGDRIVAASSRRNPSVRKGEIVIHVGA